MVSISVFAVDVWDRPVSQINYTAINNTLANYYTKTQIDYFLSQINLNISALNVSIQDLYSITYYLNQSFINLNTTVYGLYNNVSYLYNFTQEINDSLLFPQGDYFIINSPYFVLNESKLNKTIRDISKIYEYTHNFSVMATSGVGFNVSTSLIGFEIKEIIVYPSIVNNKYRFQLEQYPSMAVIDRDRIQHIGVWDIEKNYAINYSQVSANITNVLYDDNFTVSVRYLSNGVE